MDTRLEHKPNCGQIRSHLLSVWGQEQQVSSLESIAGVQSSAPKTSHAVISFTAQKRFWFLKSFNGLRPNYRFKAETTDREHLLDLHAHRVTM